MKHAPSSRMRNPAGSQSRSPRAKPPRARGRTAARSTTAPGASSSGSGALIPDPRVKGRVQQVRKQVGDHNDRAEDDDDPLDDGHVVVADGLDQDGSHAG